MHIRPAFLRFLISAVLFMVSVAAFSQSEWEDVDSSYFNWGDNGQLKIESRSLTNLSIWNYHAEAPETKGWSHYDVTMDISWREPKPWVVSFKIKNDHNRHDYKYSVVDADGADTWHTDDVYWGFKLGVNNYAYEEEVFTVFYCNRKTLNNRDTYTDIWTSDAAKWTNVEDKDSHNVVIEYNGAGVVTISIDNKNAHTFRDASSLSSITICAGSAADIRVTDFTARRRSLYADVSSYVRSGNTKFENKDYWEASQDYSAAIDKGYKNFDIYYRRGLAFFFAAFYSNAIDDFTSALEYSSSEEAYFYRGMAKLKRDDITAVDDLKKGGSRGLTVIKELELESYEEVEDEDVYEIEGVPMSTGFFVDPNGYIVTSARVLVDAEALEVMMSRNGEVKRYMARSVAVDHENDLAIIKITDPEYVSLPSIPYLLGNGKRPEGTPIFTIGYQQYTDYEQVISEGEITAVSSYDDDYYISVPVFPGNCGAPLFDINGRVIGVVNPSAENSYDESCAIQASYIKALMETCQEIYSTSLLSKKINNLEGLHRETQFKSIAPYIVMVKAVLHLRGI